MAALDFAAVRSGLEAIAARVEERKDWLTQLDAQVGDGDLGLTMNRGFAHLAKAAAEYSEPAIGEFFVRGALEFNKVSPSTMGTLIASGLMQLGRAWKGKESLTAEELTKGLQAAAGGIQTRGKASLGDKTILDALFPAVDAAAGAAAEGKNGRDLWLPALAAAKAGWEATKTMTAKHGRGRWHQENDADYADAGAGLAVVIFEALAAAD